MAKKRNTKKIRNLHVKCPKCSKKYKIDDMEVVQETLGYQGSGF